MLNYYNLKKKIFQQKKRQKKTSAQDGSLNLFDEGIF